LALVERSVKGLVLTESGRDLIEQVQNMGEAASLISMIAEGKSQEVSGEVTISATDLMATAVIPKILSRLKGLAPKLVVRLIYSNNLHNLLQREADIAVRHVRPEQADLVARHIGNFGANLYASEAYLSQVERPQSRRAVANLDFIGMPDQERLMQPLQDLGIPVRAENFAMKSDSGMVSWELTKQGFGVSMQPNFLAAGEAGIERVIEDLPSPQYPVWLATHRELKTSAKIRLIFDTLATGLSETLTP
jgi:DNA-binding transcriptional LysR family regulator